MSVYSITYDLKNGDHDYSDLYKFLEGLNSIHPFESVWFADTPLSVKELKEAIWATLHNKKDTVFVANIRQLKDCAAQLKNQSDVDWLKSPLRSWDGLQ